MVSMNWRKNLIYEDDIVLIAESEDNSTKDSNCILKRCAEGGVGGGGGGWSEFI